MIKFFLIFFLLFSFNSYSLSINETIDSTVKNNYKVKIGLEKLIESKELISKSLGEKLPSITGTISGTYSTSESKATTGTTTPETFTDKYKLSITQNLYDAGFNDLEIKRSKLLYEDELINFQISLQDLFVQAITGYFTVINYEKTLEATKKNFESVTKALEETKTRYELGSSSLFDLQSSESAYAVAKANFYAADQNFKISKKSFKNIVSKDPINLEEIVKINSSIDYESSLNKLYKHNSNLKLLINKIENNKILLLKEQKTKKPNLDFTSSAEYSDAGRLEPGTESTSGSIALTLTVPIFQQNIDNSNIRKYHSQILQSELEYENLKEELEIEISNLYRDFNISLAEIESNLFIIKATETSIEIISQEYDIGTKTIMDLIQEESKLLTAKVDYLNSKKNYYISYFKIKSLEGTLLNDFEEFLPKFN